MRYCQLCNRYIERSKSKWNWGAFIVLCFTIVGGLGYALYHVFLKSKNRCPICNTKKLTKYSPEDALAKKEARQETFENIKSTAGNVMNSVKDTVDSRVKSDN